MISASVYRESSTLLNIGVNRANFTNTIEPTKNCQKVKFNAMFATVILLRGDLLRSLPHMKTEVKLNFQANSESNSK